MQRKLLTPLNHSCSTWRWSATNWQNAWARVQKQDPMADSHSPISSEETSMPSLQNDHQLSAVEWPDWDKQMYINRLAQKKLSWNEKPSTLKAIPCHFQQNFLILRRMVNYTIHWIVCLTRLENLDFRSVFFQFLSFFHVFFTIFEIYPRSITSVIVFWRFFSSNQEGQS